MGTTLAGIERKTGAGPVTDLGEGIVEALANVTNIVDHGRDLVVPGAYADTLLRRTPKAVWSHDWTRPVGKVLAVEEWLPGDPRLPQNLKALNAGALYVKVQFNLDSELGREAYAYCKFFGPEAEWSIGYDCNGPAGKAERDPSGVRRLVKVNLHEVSPVLFGMAPHTTTLSVKSADGAVVEEDDEDVIVEDDTDDDGMPDDETDPVAKRRKVFSDRLSGAGLTRLVIQAKGTDRAAAAARGVLTRYGIDWKNFGNGNRGSLSPLTISRLMAQARGNDRGAQAARSTLSRYGIDWNGAAPNTGRTAATLRSGRPATDKQRSYAAVLLRQNGRKPSLADNISDSGVMGGLIDALRNGDMPTVDNLTGANRQNALRRAPRTGTPEVNGVTVNPLAIRDAAIAMNRDYDDDGNLVNEVAEGTPTVRVTTGVNKRDEINRVNIEVGIRAADGGWIPASEMEVRPTEGRRVDRQSGLLALARSYAGNGVTIEAEVQHHGTRFTRAEHPDGTVSHLPEARATALTPEDLGVIGEWERILPFSKDPIVRNGPIVSDPDLYDDGNEAEAALANWEQEQADYTAARRDALAQRRAEMAADGDAIVASSAFMMGVFRREPPRLVERARQTDDIDEAERLMTEARRLIMDGLRNLDPAQRAQAEAAADAARQTAGTKSADGLVDVTAEIEEWAALTADLPVVPGTPVQVTLPTGTVATGIVEKIAHEGRMKVPNGLSTVLAKTDDPAVLVRLYRDGRPTHQFHGANRSAVTPLNGATR